MVGVNRFYVKSVKRSARYATFGQGLVKFLLVHQAAARYINEVSRRFHHTQPALINQMTSFLVQVKIKGEEIALTDQPVQVCRFAGKFQTEFPLLFGRDIPYIDGRYLH